MVLIKCGRHAAEHPLDDFSPSQQKPGGWCNLAYRERQAGNVAHQRANRNARFKREYGITHDEYDTMLEEQGGVCAICGTAPSRRRLAVDHDHATGQVRSLLCENCNRAIGQLQDSAHIVAIAADYLANWY